MPTIHSKALPKRWDMPFSMESTTPVEMEDIDAAWLHTLPPFCKLKHSDFRNSLTLWGILKNDTRYVQLEDGDTVFKQGEWGSSAFLVLRGNVHVSLETGAETDPTGATPGGKRGLLASVARLWNQPAAVETAAGRVYLQDISAVLDKKQTACLGISRWFGEVSALSRSARVATVTAVGETELLEIRWQGLRDILRFDRGGTFRKHLDAVFREHALVAFLRTHPMFQGLDDASFEDLAQQAKFDTYGKYDSPAPFRQLAAGSINGEPIVVRQGDYPNDVFFVRSGVARVTEATNSGPRTVGYVTAGQAFGLEELLDGEQASAVVPYRYSLRALGYLNVIRIPRRIIAEILATAQGDAHNRPAIESCGTSNEQANLDRPLLQFLVNGRYVQGKAAMVINLDQCTRCDDCVSACAATHGGTTRFVRDGPVHGHHMISNACLQCADPVCLIECPTGAIRQDARAGLIVINEPTCIGCTKCETNCPFDAIRMVENQHADGGRVVDERNGKALLHATKCDLCIDRSGQPACVAACSPGALSRVDLSDPLAILTGFQQ